MRARILIALALMGAVAGCNESGFDESKETQRPLKVQHALDELTGTKVPGQAVRPLTLTADALGDTLALDVEPVGAVDVPPYLKEEARGVEVLPPDDPVYFEQSAPDVILGSKELQGGDYEVLRTIAPTVMTEGYDWILNLRLHGEALGRTNDAEKLLVDWDNRLAKVKQAIAGRDLSVVFRPRPRELDLGPKSFAGTLLKELGLKEGSGGPDVIVVRAGQEWTGTGGLLGARDALGDVAAAL